MMTLAQIDEARRAIVRWHDAISAGRCPRCGAGMERQHRRIDGFLYALPCGCRLVRRGWRKGWRRKVSAG